MTPTLELADTVAVGEVRTRLREDIDLLDAALRDGSPPEHDPGWTAASRRVLPRSFAGIEREIRFLRQLLAGLDRLPHGTVPRVAAGYGSQIYVRDLPSGRERVHRLVVGVPDPRDAGQIPLDTPLGEALLGARTGDVVTARLPDRMVRVRVFSVRTLPARLGI